MREYTAATQQALLLHLADSYRQGATPQSETLWTVRKDDRELVYLVKYLPSGIDVRLLEGVDFRRTRLVRDEPAARVLADQWKTKLIQVGWTD